MRALGLLSPESTFFRFERRRLWQEYPSTNTTGHGHPGSASVWRGGGWTDGHSEEDARKGEEEQSTHSRFSGLCSLSSSCAECSPPPYYPDSLNVFFEMQPRNHFLQEALLNYLDSLSPSPVWLGVPSLCSLGTLAIPLSKLSSAFVLVSFLLIFTPHSTVSSLIQGTGCASYL